MHYNSMASREGEEKVSQKEAKCEPKGNQKDTKTEPTLCPNEKGTSKSTLCRTGANKLRKRMRNRCKCMEPKSIPKVINKSMKIQVTEKLTKIMNNDDKTMPECNQKS